MSDDNSDTSKSTMEESEAPPRPMGWIRRASKQVESAGAAFRKIGLKVTIANKLGPRKKKQDTGDDAPRLFTFDPTAIQRGASLCDLFESDEIEEDFNEIVDLDDERVEEVVSQEMVGRLVDSMWFRGMILSVIVVNAILIGAQTNKELSQKYAWLFFAFDHTVLSIFVAELILKWYNGFTIYWKVGWNILDFGIILVLLLGPALTFLGSSRILRILRVLRAFRGLRSVSALTGLSVVVQTVFQSIPDMTNIGLLLVIIMVVLSVVGVFLFGDDFPKNFGNLPAAMFSLFICVTQDGWVGLFDELKNTPHHYMGAIYFIVAIVVGAFVFANLVVAVVVTNLDKAVKEVKQENKMREDILSSKGLGGEEESAAGPDQNKELPITSVDDVTAKTDMIGQKPLYFGDFAHLTTEKFQNYLVLISALEENLAEYNAIKIDLDKIFHLIWELNENEEDDEEEEVLSQQDLGTPTVPDIVDLKKIGKRGDILSNLMELEQYKLISTRRGSLSGAIKDAARHVSAGATRRFSGTSSRDTKRKKSKTDLEAPSGSGSGTSLRNRRPSATSKSKSRDRLSPGGAEASPDPRPTSARSMPADDERTGEQPTGRVSRSSHASLDNAGTAASDEDRVQPLTVITISPSSQPSLHEHSDESEHSREKP